MIKRPDITKVNTVAFCTALLSLSSLVLAQQNQEMTPQQAAPIALEGYWVSIVSEDWRWRMVTPARGDYASIPLTPAAKDRADQWDPAADEAAGEECRSYGAPAIMRVPGRIRFEWLDEYTLQMEADAGMQTRIFYFGDRPAADEDPSWQGTSTAEWVYPRQRGGLANIGMQGGFGLPRGMGSEAEEYGAMKVVTSNLRPGYLRKNGVPYSADTVMTEYFDVHVMPDGERWLIVTSNVHDPDNLQVDWLTSLNFKQDPEGARSWTPSECSAVW